MIVYSFVFKEEFYILSHVIEHRPQRDCTIFFSALTFPLWLPVLLCSTDTL